MCFHVIIQEKNWENKEKSGKLWAAILVEKRNLESKGSHIGSSVHKRGNSKDLKPLTSRVAHLADISDS